MLNQCCKVFGDLDDYEASANNTGCLINMLKKYRKVFGDVNDYEARAINAGCLKVVILRHQCWLSQGGHLQTPLVFGDTGKLSVTDLPQVTITTKPGTLVMQHPYRMVQYLRAAMYCCKPIL